MVVPAKAVAREMENVAAKTSHPLRDQNYTALAKKGTATEAAKDSEMALEKET
jgi:hypothetical protein